MTGVGVHTRMNSFAAELRRAQRYRAVLSRDLGLKIGLRAETISNLRTGAAMPSLRSAMALAEALDWPTLGEIALRDRSGACVVCDSPFVSNQVGANTRQYCGKRCRALARNRVVLGRRSAKSVVMARRLATFQAAVDAFCRGCEPEGLCRTPDCELRPVSPLGLAKMRGCGAVRAGR